MSLRSGKAYAGALRRVAFAAMICLFAADVHAQRGADPFAPLPGSWSGSGTVKMVGGGTERIRCRANYAVATGGKTLQQSLTCASESYKFELKSMVEHTAGAILGMWSETIRNVTGNLTGQAAGDQILVRVDAGGFTADLTVVTRGNQQSVVIRPQGSEVAEVSIRLVRGGSR